MNIILPNISNNARNNGIKRFIYTNNNLVNCEITEVGDRGLKNKKKIFFFSATKV
jgi:hypothetical protein